MGARRGLTYAQLLLAAHARSGDPRQSPSRVEQALAELGVGRGDGVGVLAAGGPESAVAVAALHARGARVTFLHPLATAAAQAEMLADAQVSTLVFDARIFEQRAGELAPALDRLLALAPSELGEDLLARAQRFAPRRVEPLAEPDDIAFVQYTSGTTGRPKGVAVTQRTMAQGALVALAELDWPAEVRLLGCIPMAQVMLVPARLRGGSGRLVPFDPELVLRLIEVDRSTMLCVSPPMIAALLDSPALARADLSSLETILYASTPAAPALLERALEAFGPILCQVYASTEATHAVTVLRKRDHDPARPDRLASCGRPAIGVDVAIRDAAGAELGPGETGEVWVRGASVADGYWRRPELTAEAFRDGWFRMGDVGRLDDDGFLTVVDRRVHALPGDVYFREVEDVLAAHPSVSLAVVYGSDASGAPAVAVRPRRDEHPRGEELVRFVAERGERIPRPASVDVVAEIPLLAAGKPDRARLAADLGNVAR